MKKSSWSVEIWNTRIQKLDAENTLLWLQKFRSPALGRQHLKYIFFLVVAFDIEATTQFYAQQRPSKSQKELSFNQKRKMVSWWLIMKNNTNSITSYELYLTGFQQSHKSPMKLSHWFLAVGSWKSGCNTPTILIQNQSTLLFNFLTIKNKTEKSHQSVSSPEAPVPISTISALPASLLSLESRIVKFKLRFGSEEGISSTEMISGDDDREVPPPFMSWWRMSLERIPIGKFLLLSSDANCHAGIVGVGPIDGVAGNCRL